MLKCFKLVSIKTVEVRGCIITLKIIFLKFIKR